MEKVKLTKGEVLKVSAGINVLALSPTKAWYAVSRNQKKLAPVVKQIFEEKQLIFDKLGQRNEKGQLVYTDETKQKIKFQDGKQEEADTLWMELQQESIEVEVYQFPVSQLEGEKLSPGMMQPLLGVIITMEE